MYSDLNIDEKIAEMEIKDTDLSLRARRYLLSAGIKTVADLMQFDTESLLVMRNCGKGTVDELESFIVRLTNGDIEQPVPTEYTMDSLVTELGLSRRSQNCLRRNEIKTASQLVELSKDDLLSMRNLGEKSADEIWKTICVLRGTDPESRDGVEPETQLLIEVYFESHDIPIEDLNLSTRAYNCLNSVGLKTLSDIIKTPLHDLAGLKNVGNGTINEIRTLVKAYTTPVLSKIKEGEITAENVHELTVDETQNILIEIMSHSDDAISVEEFSDLIKDASEENIRSALENLETQEKIIGTESGYEIRFPSIFEVVDHLDNPKHKEVLIARLEGRTLGEVGEMFNITRERTRQIQNATIRKVKAMLRLDFGADRFAEDNYRYFYKSYDISRKVWVDELGLDEKLYMLLTLMYVGGNKKVKSAIDDPELPVDLRKAIQKYADKGYLIMGNRRIKIERSSLENYAISKIAKDEIPYDEFVLKYNFFISVIAGIEDEGYLITESIRQTRVNHFMASRKVLWKTGRILRYYNIDANDYNPLIDTLALNDYHDTEISTRKLFLLYPDIMEEYDIRDEYELHNLLKKIAEEYNLEITFGRTPGLGFGTFDRNAMVFELMSSLAPISQDELAETLAETTGYQKGTILANWLVELAPYYHNGEYRIDLPDLPDDHKALLMKELSDDFYYTDEIRQIYHRMVANYDDRFINSYSLKKMGFIVNSTHVVRNFSSAADYFCHRLTDNDIVDIAPLQKRFGQLGAYQITLYTLRRNYKIVEFEPHNYISLRKLSEQGIFLDDIIGFCDMVSEMVDDEYFTIKKLRERGLETELDMLGFDDWFLAGLIREDSRFIHMLTGGGTSSGQLLLKRGYEKITRKTFIEYLINDRGSMNFDDLMDCIEDEYGLILDISRDNIDTLIEDTALYYDRIMDKLYADYETYYEEI